MKISVRNLGVIKDEAHFDLKPLTIFIGPNNSGKTWLAYTIAGIFGKAGYQEYVTRDASEQLLQKYPPITRAIDSVLNMGTATLDMSQFAENYTGQYFSELAAYSKEWLPDYLGTQLSNFDSLKLAIDLDEEKAQYVQNILQSDWQISVGLPKPENTSIDNQPKSLFNARKKAGQKDLHMYTSTEGDPQERLPRQIIEDQLKRLILRSLHTALFPAVVTLPTERTTFVTFPFNAFEELALKQEASVANEEMAIKQTVQTPVADYLHSAIRTSRLSTKEKARREKSRTPAIRAYVHLSHLLEDRILGGNIDFSHPEPDPSREIVFQPEEGNASIEISATSSMVKELTPLAFYLRYFARPGELLIIDEPEMNLHPRAQAQMIEFLAMLVNAGLHVLVTTHSPYMLDHLNNLTLAYDNQDKETIRSAFFLQDTQAFIEKDKAAVYLISGGKFKSVLNNDNDEDEEEWDTFGKISDQISDIYFKL